MTARRLFWPGFYGLVLLAWAALWAMGQELRGFAAYGPEFWLALCRAGAADLAFAPLVAMWAVMAAAMMAPTFVPALATFLGLPARPGALAEAWALVAGYLALWAGASVLFAGAQWGLARQGWLAPDGRSLSGLFTAVLFLLAGGYQFTALKMGCLTRCRLPLTYFMEHWRPGLRPAFAIGLRLGADCLGCCWALMALAFVGGMGNLLWMGLATAVMVLEKLPEVGRPVTRPLGWVLVAAGVVTAVVSAGLALAGA